MIRGAVPCSLTLLLCLTLVAAQAAPVGDALARVRVNGHLAEWLPQVEAEEIILRLVAPDGMVRSFRFPAGTAPSLALFDEQGQPLPDGLYTYEIQAAPPHAPARRGVAARAAMRAGKSALDEIRRTMLDKNRLKEGSLLPAAYGKQPR